VEAGPVKTFFALGLLLAIATASSPAHAAVEEVAAVKTVVANGIGDTPQSAAQNAAENALTEVVGSFIDKETLLQKRVEIQDGVRQEAKQIDTKIREYSQGSIKSFDIVDTSQVSGLYKVTAKVEVRIEDFKVFIGKLAEAQTSLGPDIFAQVATKAAQETNIKDIIVNKIMMPLISGEATELKVGKPIVFDEYARKHPELKRNQYLRASSTAIVVPVITNINAAYLANATKTLESIAFAKKTVPTKQQMCEGRYTLGRLVDGFDYRRDGVIAITRTETMSDIYFLKDVGDVTSNRRGRTPSLYVSINGGSGPIYETLIEKGQVFSAHRSSDEKITVIGTRYPFKWLSFTVDGRGTRGSRGCVVIAARSFALRDNVGLDRGAARSRSYKDRYRGAARSDRLRSAAAGGNFDLIMDLDPSLLKQAKSISVKLSPN
jgi:hypothetical protein